MTKENYGKDVVVTKKLSAADLRKATRSARNRLFSDSSDELPKGILKSARFPTKRSASECIEDLSQIMADLDLNINDLPNATSKFCPRHQYYIKEEEEQDHDDDEPESVNEAGDAFENNDINGNLKKKCYCEINYGDNDEKPKKSVRFDERVYELKFASKLYDPRAFAKYRFSSRHHPKSNNQSSNKSKKNRHNSSKSNGKNEHGCSATPENQCKTKQTKSQRAKQSKRDKKKLQHRDEHIDTSSEDQGYCSSIHSLSD